MHVLYLSMLCPHNCNKTLLTEVDLNWWDKTKNNTSSSILCVCVCVCVCVLLEVDTELWISLLQDTKIFLCPIQEVSNYINSAAIC